MRLSCWFHGASRETVNLQAGQLVDAIKKLETLTPKRLCKGGVRASAISSAWNGGQMLGIVYSADESFRTFQNKMTPGGWPQSYLAWNNVIFYNSAKSKCNASRDGRDKRLQLGQLYAQTAEGPASQPASQDHQQSLITVCPNLASINFTKRTKPLRHSMAKFFSTSAECRTYEMLFVHQLFEYYGRA